MNRGKLIIISAPSGTGKTTVIERFLSTHPKTVHSISWTTRPVRGDEKQGAYYYHVEKDEFEKGIKEGKFAEWAEYVGNYYGTPKAQLEDWLTHGKFVLLDLEVVGGTTLKSLYKDDAISIFLLPPSEDELKKRLSRRATDSAEVQQRRLQTALMELTFKDRYDFQVVNDDLDGACSEIEKIINNSK
ncbi:guanylate kinase [bacterium]|nr:guanylate kinase [bacterium]